MMARDIYYFLMLIFPIYIYFLSKIFIHLLCLFSYGTIWLFILCSESLQCILDTSLLLDMFCECFLCLGQLSSLLLPWRTVLTLWEWPYHQ